MAKKTAPTQGLSYGWERGEDFWGGPVNEDLLFIDALIQPNAQSMSFSTPPADVLEGDIYIVADPGAGAWASHGNELAVLVEGGWTFYTPREGWRVRVKSIAEFVFFDGTAWLSESSGTNPNNPGTSPVVKATAYDVAATVTDVLYAGEAIVHLPILDALMLPADMAGAQLHMLTASQAYVQLRVQRNGQNVGTITIAQGATTATFATASGSAVRYATGDRLTILAPDTVVQSFKNFGFVIRLNFV